MNALMVTGRGVFYLGNWAPRGKCAAWDWAWYSRIIKSEFQLQANKFFLFRQGRGKETKADEDDLIDDFSKQANYYAKPLRKWYEVVNSTSRDKRKEKCNEKC